MSEMVERVARALCVARGIDPEGFTGFVVATVPARRTRNWEAARSEAHAAIAAIREPTEAMATAGTGHGLDQEHWHVTRARWRAMIDAALKED